jgi:hypothetical protein
MVVRIPASTSHQASYIIIGDTSAEPMSRVLAGVDIERHKRRRAASAGGFALNIDIYDIDKSCSI